MPYKSCQYFTDYTGNTKNLTRTFLFITANILFALANIFNLTRHKYFWKANISFWKATFSNLKGQKNNLNRTISFWKAIIFNLTLHKYFCKGNISFCRGTFFNLTGKISFCKGTFWFCKAKKSGSTEFKSLLPLNIKDADTEQLSYAKQNQKSSIYCHQHFLQHSISTHATAVLFIQHSVDVCCGNFL